jgi:hypothetical protein
MEHRMFNHWSDQTKDLKIVICCFSDNHVTLRAKTGFSIRYDIQLNHISLIYCPDYKNFVKTIIGLFLRCQVQCPLNFCFCLS